MNSVQIQGILYELVFSDYRSDCNLRTDIGCRHCFIACTGIDRNYDLYNFVLVRSLKNGND